MLQNTSVQRLEGGNPTTGLPSGRLVTCPREISVTFEPQYKDKETAKLTKNCGKKAVKRKWKRQNIMKYPTFKVRGIAHKEEELGCLLNEKQIKISVITSSKKGN
jgi:hypothetical protein